MATWDKLDDVNKNIANEPWSMYWNEMKSGTQEFEDFLHEPLKVLCGALDGVDESFTVQSNILNHEVGLVNSIVCQVAIVDYQKKIVYLTLYKH